MVRGRLCPLALGVLRVIKIYLAIKSFSEVSANFASSSVSQSYLETTPSVRTITHRFKFKHEPQFPRISHRWRLHGGKSRSPNDRSRFTWSKVVLLTPRGGSRFVPGDDKLTFGENLSGSLFSFLSLLYGFACGIDPRGSALVLYGYDKGKISSADNASVKFLMRLIGSIMTGIGLTAAFSVALELKVLGRMPDRTSLHQAIGIGFIPRAVLALRYTFFKETTNRIRLLEHKWFWLVSLMETMSVATTLILGKLMKPIIAVTFEVSKSIIIGALLFVMPSLLFKNSATPPTKHEKLMTRLLSMYLVMNAVLIWSLHHPSINALPASGLASLTWGLCQFYVTFISSDMKACDCSVVGSFVVILLALSVAVGALQNYIVL